MGPDPIGRIRALAARYGERLFVQLREKDLSARALSALVEALFPDLGPRLLVNDRVDVARSFPGVGVHLPERGLDVRDARRILGPGPRIGVSAHSVDAAIEARRAGADLVTLSPIYETPGKGVPLGLGALARAAPAGGIFALGGVSLRHAADVAATGAAGLAAIRCFWGGGVSIHADDDRDSSGA